MLFEPIDGETVCFIGDSITHAGAYHKIVTDVWTLRRPERRVRWVNCGISGDSAGGALERFERDIATHRPTWAFVLFGMNDGNRGLYERRLAGTTDNAAARAKAIEAHVANLCALVARLRGIGTREIILISPTVYDQYTRLEADDNLYGYDDALAEMGEAARALAERTGCGFVDLHAAFLAAVRAEAAIGKATYVGADRVHPPPVGHLLMAVTMLEALGTPKGVTRTEVSVGCGAVAENAVVSGVTSSAGRLEWTCAARSLPCVAPAEAWVAAPAALQAAWRALNRETVAIQGLGAGTYELSVDGQKIAEADAAAWADGVDLAAIPCAPQVMQAAEVCRLTEVRHQLAVARVRNPTAARMFLKWDRYGLQQRGIVLPADEAAAARHLVERGEGNPYILGLYRDLLEHGSAAATAHTAAQLADMDGEIRRASAIPARQYVLSRG